MPLAHVERVGLMTRLWAAVGQSDELSTLAETPKDHGY